MRGVYRKRSLPYPFSVNGEGLIVENTAVANINHSLKHYKV